MSSNDEFGMLATTLNVLLEQVRQFVGKAGGSADALFGAADALKTKVGQSAQATEKVARSIEEVARGAEREVESVSESAEVLRSNLRDTEQIAGKARVVERMTLETVESAEKGKISAETAVRQMKHIEEAVGASADLVERLGERSKEIDQIVAAISAIAGQTNLLALNAAIEAARAGEQGRGFSVVADEVRKLAEESQEAAKKISGLIAEIQSDTGRAVVAMAKGKEEVYQGAGIVETAGRNFKEIVEMVEQMSAHTVEIAEAIVGMSEGSRKMSDAIGAVKQISEDISGQAQTVSAATQEQSSAMETIAASSRQLTKMAQELKEAVNGFEV